MKRNYLFVWLLVMVACGKDETPEPPTEVATPKAAILVGPAQNEVCTTGTILSDTESLITFVWKTAENAESYELNYKNLETGVIESITTNNTTASIKLVRNMPYSWKIIARSSKTPATATSEIWKFYNAGDGILAYAPYPAELTAPLLGSTVTPVSGKISLSWKATDPDGDIVGYQVYFGTASNPPLYKSDLTISNITDVPVSNNTTYYWMVVTKDSKGNTSSSETGQFKTN